MLEFLLAYNMLIMPLLPGCFAGHLLYSLAAFHLLFRSCQLAVLFLYNTHHPGNVQNDSPVLLPGYTQTQSDPVPELNARRLQVL